jgi:hypothetical protein
VDARGRDGAALEKEDFAEETRPRARLRAVLDLHALEAAIADEALAAAVPSHIAFAPPEATSEHQRVRKIKEK